MEIWIVYRLNEWEGQVYFLGAFGSKALALQAIQNNPALEWKLAPLTLYRT